MGPGQRPEFCRQSEGQEEVLGRDLLVQLPFQPLLTLVVLTVRAVAMAAGMRDQHGLRTSAALDLHLRADLAAALLHRRQGSIVLSGESIPELRAQVGLEGLDDGGQPDHLTLPHTMLKPFIKPLMRSMA